MNYGKNHQLLLRFAKSILRFILVFSILPSAQASTKSSIATGNWNNPSTWSPAGIPSVNDDVLIQPNHIVTIDNNTEINSVIVNTGAELKFITGKIITLHNSLTVNGKFTMNGGDINFLTPASFALGPASTFTWEPSNNSASGATLFTKGIEHFDATSTLIINKWYDYASVPLGSVVTGDFGNVTLNSLSNGFLFEWNQNNQFETHKIPGTLKIEQGWIVLDKSGSISNTSIGNINLATSNAYLDFFNGSHPSSFTINTNSISNSGGTLNGIYNGTGNINLNINGNFTNTGNVVLIYNTGVFGFGNGNAVLNVAGDFIQSSGDFRAIFNLTTHAAGVSNLNFKNVLLTGGIMMGHYACHTASSSCIFKVTGNLEINFTHPTDKFRIVGLTSLMGTFNNAKSNLSIDGNLILSGYATSEFTSSGSVGSESITIGGNILISGITSNINMGSHAVNFSSSGNLTMSGGTFSFSKTSGVATLSIGGNFFQSAGSLSVKGNTGSAKLTVVGNFSLLNGNLFLHNNTQTASNDSIALTVLGNFEQANGIINYDDNVTGTSINTINIRGNQYKLGNGKITHAGAGNNTVAGVLNFATNGTVSLQRNSTHVIEQVKQVISPGCKLEVINSNLQLGSFKARSLDMLTVLQGGVLEMNEGGIISNAQSSYSGLTINNGGRITLKHINGLYNGTSNACISASGNLDYYLAPNSIVEYNGSNSQVLTGLGNGLATTDHHKYGILEINFQHTSNDKNVYLSSPVSVRTALVLTKGELKLNNNILTIETGTSSGISRISGYIRSETNNTGNPGILKWMSITTGTYIFPFGTSYNEFIPVSINPVNGNGGTVSIATWATSADNLPYPNGGAVPSATSLSTNGIDISKSSVIDRWFYINASGLKANVTLAYRGIENTTIDSLRNTQLSIFSWDGNKWGVPMGYGNNVKTGIGAITANSASNFNYLIISATKPFVTNNFLDFTAALKENKVAINWGSNSGTALNYFAIERSVDQVNFSEIGRVEAAGIINELQNYSYTDDSPLKGISYYRLKLTGQGNQISYSRIRRIKNADSNVQDFSIICIIPNPFKDHFSISFTSGNGTPTELLITGINGQFVRSETINTLQGMNSYEYFEKQNLQPGIYVITLRNGPNVISKKILKS